MLTPIDTSLADRRILEWQVRQRARAQAGPAASPQPPVVTISRELGTDDGEIAAALWDRLGSGWQIWDSELLDEVARRSDAPRKLLAAVDEKVQSQIEIAIRGLIGAPVVDDYTYRHHLAQTMLALAHHGYAIIVGRGGNIIVREALKVRLRAPREARIENLCRAHGLTREEADRRIRDADRVRRDFIRSEFGRDIDDPDAYDLILRTDTLGIRTSAATIAAAVRARFSLPG